MPLSFCCDLSLKRTVFIVFHFIFTAAESHRALVMSINAEVGMGRPRSEVSGDGESGATFLLLSKVGPGKT